MSTQIIARKTGKCVFYKKKSRLYIYNMYIAIFTLAICLILAPLEGWTVSAPFCTRQPHNNNRYMLSLDERKPMFLALIQFGDRSFQRNILETLLFYYRTILRKF